ncbi:response regulator [Actinokineospora bangkokensis]|uniref:DNA-binding response regulator n=1 Tax=Actinokineospora bangkokensis TaxID=1193682 RepID=A0A1Q9LMC2_9PSEU|nr:response regulator transcription factor [Actinokineospora bangkokensis]OLR93178.1 DNA-binding response regulator [Actinokineospora bangkokensis]
MITVVLADDEAGVRAAVRAVLETDPGLEVVAEAADGRAAVDAVLRHRPDVVLLDVRMPGLDGLAAAAELHRGAPATAVVILTTFGDDEHIARALGVGASGFLLKAGDPRELLAAVRAVSDGAAYLSPRVARRVISGLSGDRLARSAAARKLTEQLTARERDVLVRLARGRSNAEIAKELSLVEGTVKTHVSSILNRLGVRNRVEAAIVGHEAHLVDGA